MANEVHVYSTLTASNEYRQFSKGGADLPVVARSILIYGGANLPSKHMLTPRGVLTTISAEVYSWLKDEPTFKAHVANGFITVSNGGKAEDPDKVAADLEGRDQSAPLVEEDFAPGEAPQTKTPGNDDGAAPGLRRGRRA